MRHAQTKHSMRTVIQPTRSTRHKLAPPLVPLGNEQYVTRQQVAGILNVHTETVKRWARAGRLRAFVFSGTVTRYAMSDVQRLIEDARCPVRPAA